MSGEVEQGERRRTYLLTGARHCDDGLWAQDLVEVEEVNIARGFDRGSRLRCQSFRRTVLLMVIAVGKFPIGYHCKNKDRGLKSEKKKKKGPPLTRTIYSHVANYIHT